MNEVSLKHRLRSMKREEIRLRNDGATGPVWRRFFDGAAPLYRRELLLAMDEGAFAMVEQDFYAEVLYYYFQKRGVTDLLRDPEQLAVLGLPLTADADDIKKRFRELAHQHHPDHGGNAEIFRRILEAYRKLND